MNTSQQVGGALGFAALASLATLRTESLAAGIPADAAAAGGLAVVFLGAAALAVVAAAIVAASMLRARRELRSYRSRMTYPA